jgi:hypothetical protein
MEIGDCRHWRGTVEKTCEAGVVLRSLVGGTDFGWVTRLPCRVEHRGKNQCVTCDKLTPVSAEEVAAHDREVEVFVERATREMELCYQLVDRLKKECRGQTGHDVCPVCGGTLRWAVAAYNGHVRLVCSTEDCVNVWE